MSRAVVAVLAVGGAMLGSVAPASAMAGDCDAKLCMWEDSWYAGDRYALTSVVSGCREIDWWHGDNEISSASNQTGRAVKLYDGDNCTGAEFFVGAGWHLPELSRYGFSDRAESYAFQ